MVEKLKFNVGQPQRHDKQLDLALLAPNYNANRRPDNYTNERRNIFR